LGDDRADKKASRTVLGFIGENIDIQLPGEIIDSHKQIFTRLIDRSTFQKDKPLGIEMN